MSYRARAVAAVGVLILPVAALLVLFFGGPRLDRICLSTCDAHLVPGPIPVIGTSEGLIASLVGLSLAWLGSLLILGRHLRAAPHEVRRRLLRWIIVAAILGVLFVSAYVYASDHRLRNAAVGGGIGLVLGAVVGLATALAWWGWRRPEVSKEDERSGGAPYSDR